MFRDFAAATSSVAAIVGVVAALVGVGIYVGNTQSDIESNQASIVAVNEKVRKLEDGWARHLESHLSQTENK